MFPTIVFVVPGEPTGKGRHRTRVVNSKYGKPFAHQYPDKETVSYENLVKLCFKEAVEKFDREWQHKGEYAVQIAALYSIPASKPKIWKELALEKTIRPTKKPDLDNIAKIICDALNSIAWKDDSMVVDLKVKKFYTFGPPEVIVQITNITDIRNHWIRKA